MFGNPPKTYVGQENYQSKSFIHFGKNGKVGNFAFETSSEPCSFGWEMLGIWKNGKLLGII